MNEPIHLSPEAEPLLAHLLRFTARQRLAAGRRLLDSLTEQEQHEIEPIQFVSADRPVGEIYDRASRLRKELSVGDRLFLAALITEVITEADRRQVHQNAMNELRRRVQEIESGAVEGIPVDQVFRAAEKRLAEMRREAEEQERDPR